MLTFVFGNKSKEDAFAMRDLFCSALVGIPGFIENEIMVSSVIYDDEGNEYPDGEGIYKWQNRMSWHLYIMVFIC